MRTSRRGESTEHEATTETVTVRLRPSDLNLLQQLVELQKTEITAQGGGRASPGTWVRAMIRREAKKRGLI